MVNAEEGKPGFVMRIATDLGGTRLPSNASSIIVPESTIVDSYQVIRPLDSAKPVHNPRTYIQLAEPPTSPIEGREPPPFFPNQTRASLLYETTPVVYEDDLYFSYNLELEPQIAPVVGRAMIATLQETCGRLAEDSQLALLSYITNKFGIKSDSLSHCLEALSARFPLTAILQELVSTTNDTEDKKLLTYVAHGFLGKVPHLTVASDVFEGATNFHLRGQGNENPYWYGTMTALSEDEEDDYEEAVSRDGETLEQEEETGEEDSDELVLTGNTWFNDKMGGKFRAWIDEQEDGHYYVFETFAGTILVPQEGKVMGQQIPLIAGMRVKFSKEVLAEIEAVNELGISDVCDSLDDHVNTILREMKRYGAGFNSGKFNDTVSLYLTYSEELEEAEDLIRVRS